MNGFGKLSALFVRRVLNGEKIEPHKYVDGGGLYLEVTQAGTASWTFRYERDGKRTYMGLGSLRAVSLADARGIAANARSSLAKGDDPLAAKREGLKLARIEAAKGVTFREAAETFLNGRVQTRNKKHNKQWRSTLENYAYPKIGSLPVSEVDRTAVLSVLDPIWTTKNPTARKVRGRIEAVLDAAAVRGQRSEENPARILSLRPVLGRKRPKAKNHPALPYRELPAFMKELRKRPGIAARALEFTILTAARTTEVLAMTWAEVGDSLWTIPGDRMKAGHEHNVPLSPRATQILAEMKELRHSRYVFPGRKGDKPASNMTMLAVLKRMKRDDLTVHGFRSTFKDWAVEASGYGDADLVSDLCLAHVVEGVKGAYLRAELLEKRRKMLTDFAKFATK
jgi:integrase